VTLLRVNVADFRCIADARLELAEDCNLLWGSNGSGKTSVLEAIGFLSRGRSFRGTRTDGLVRHGAARFLISARVRSGDREHRLGVEVGRGHMEIRVDRRPADGLAALAERLAVQVIDPEIHRLVSDGPDVRRRFLDYGVFHVEHGYLDAWRRYRRALRQRNAALRAGAEAKTVAAWEPELIGAAEAVDAHRRRHVEALAGHFAELGRFLLRADISCEYRPGWTDAGSFEEAIGAAWHRDRDQGTTTVGPHRADLKLAFRGRGARQQVSRGQQKLFGAALVLAQTRVLSEILTDPPVLLVDDPAAELDRESLGRLMERILATDSQLLATALTADALAMPIGCRMFHVEHAAISPN
jgi:DNA replication and repair protein RecF